MKIKKASLNVCGVGILSITLLSNPMNVQAKGAFRGQQDSIKLSASDSLKILSSLNNPYRTMGGYDTVKINTIDKTPVISLQQFLKGQVTGAYVQENNGEPGVNQNIYIRGISYPIINTSVVDNMQPQVYINGVPVTNTNPFVYDIQQYQSNKIGPATNTFAGININNIASIEIIKDPFALAKLGPMSSNGAIWIQTISAKAGRSEISVNGYTGFTTKPSITPVNAYYENLFRNQFYNRYASLDEKLKYPSFLSDSTNTNYYGGADWHDKYYSVSPNYNLDFGLSGGSDRANFRFFGGHTRNSNSSDDTKLKGYNASFFINMAPFTWWNISGMINGKLTDRGRNRNMRDRLEEMRYLPDLSVPMPPNAGIYQNLLNEYDKVIDDNITTNLQGDVLFTLNHAGWYLNSRLSYDYNEGKRDLFYPSTMMEGNNYISRFFGFSERVNFNNSLKKSFTLNDKSALDFEVGQNLSFDVYKYNYSYGYRGPSDFIKVFSVSGSSSNSNYLQPVSGEIYRNTDKQRLRLASYYGSLGYQYDKFEVGALLRYDGASYIQPNNRWAFSPSFRAAYTLIDQESGIVSYLKANAAWANFGKSLLDDRYGNGAQYRVDIGWNNEINVPSYNGFAVISRPYTQGWVGYNLEWAKTEQIDFTINSKLFNNRLALDLSVFQKDDKNQIFNIPVASEYGYTGAHLNGLHVRNRGIEARVGLDVVKSNKFAWTTALNLTNTTNELMALPNNVNNLVINDQFLKVGNRIDEFWVLENNGIISTSQQIPMTNGQALNVDGVSVNIGDPLWIDQNADGKIDNKDRVLKGNALPNLFGGFNNNFSYGRFSLNADIYFATGHSALNRRSANVFDFVNLENTNDINSVREIFNWQQDVDISKYPIYNPWSGTNPYRINQDLFLEKLDFVKLRSLTLSYDFPVGKEQSSIFKKFSKARIYATGHNLFTITNFSGMDPELVSETGYFAGNQLPLARSFSLGFQLSL